MAPLDNRLQAVADFVPPGLPAADIGTDHGYLAAALVQSGRVPHVIASDLNLGPCEAARHTVRTQSLQDQIEVRQGSGLEPLAPGEVDTLCIAGMGGQLIASICEASPAILHSVHTLVLQPMNAASSLRHWLYRHGWYIADEALAIADGRLYEVIQARRGHRREPEPILLTIGPILWEKKPPELRHHIESLLFTQRRAAAGMEKSLRAVRSKKYKDIMQQIKQLEAHLKW